MDEGGWKKGGWWIRVVFMEMLSFARNLKWHSWSISFQMIFTRTNVCFFFTKQQTITSLPHKRSIIKQNLYGCVPKHMKYISSYLLLVFNSLNSLEMQVWREAGFSLGNNCNRCDHHLHTSSCQTEHRVGRAFMVRVTTIVIIIWPSRAL